MAAQVSAEVFGFLGFGDCRSLARRAHLSRQMKLEKKSRSSDAFGDEVYGDIGPR